MCALHYYASHTFKGQPARNDTKPKEGPRGVPESAGSAVNLLLQYDGFMNTTVYTKAFTNIIEKYFKQPNYYKVPTKLANGTIAQCNYFAFYQFSYFVSGLGGACEFGYIDIRIFILFSLSCIFLKKKQGLGALSNAQRRNEVEHTHQWSALGGALCII